MAWTQHDMEAPDDMTPYEDATLVPDEDDRPFDDDDDDDEDEDEDEQAFKPFDSDWS